MRSAKSAAEIAIQSHGVRSAKILQMQIHAGALSMLFANQIGNSTFTPQQHSATLPACAIDDSIQGGILYENR
jgi:hypothetical protein